MDNNIVQYHNNFNLRSLKNFTPHEMDFLMALLSKAKEQSQNNNSSGEINVSFKTLKKIINYKPTSTSRFVNELISMNKKLMSLTMTCKNESEITQFVLFPTFNIDLNAKLLTARINSDFSYLIYELSCNWTRFELAEFASLRSKYSKALYRRLKQFRTTGWLYLTVDDFRESLDIPLSYKASEINKWVFPLIKEELSTLFANFEIVPKRGPGRGRPIIAYLFKFTPEKNLSKTMRVPIQTCPKCNGKLVEKVINGGLCWCHADGYKSSAKCNMIFNSIEDIISYKEQLSIVTKEQNQNIEKVKQLTLDLSKQFGFE